jgi:transposase
MPQMGYVVETQEGHVFECPKCKLKINRHKVASINIRRRHLEEKRGERRGEPGCGGIPTAMNLRKL